MKYTLVVKKSVLKQVASLAATEQRKITEAISKLADNPKPSGYIKLKGQRGFRIRVGDYRIIYNIKDDILEVTVITVGHRREVYD